MTKKSIDEVTDKVNTSETTEEDSSSEEENLEDSKETEEKAEEVESGEKVGSDYLGKEEPEEEETYKKRYGDSTRERQREAEEHKALQAKADNLSLAISNLENLAKANPKIIEEIEAAQGIVGRANQNLPASSTLIQQQINEALEPVKKVAQELQDKDRRSKVKVLAAFEKKNPKLFSPKADEKEKRAIRQRIGKVANALVETGMDFPEAVERAYLTVNPKAAVQQGKDKAYVEGLAEERAGFPSQSGTQGKKPEKPKYTKKELEIAKKMDKRAYQEMLKETK